MEPPSTTTLLGAPVGHRPFGQARRPAARISGYFFVVFIAIATVLSMSAAAGAQDQARRLVALLDYLASDYKNAVQDGKVLSEDEYGEMQEFTKRALELFRQLRELDKADKAAVEPALNSLASQVENKADAKSVSTAAKSAKEKLIAAYKIVSY